MKKIIKYIKILIWKIKGNNEALHKQRLKDMKSSGIVFGENLRCFSDINSSEPYLISIGNNVTISTNVSFITHDNSVIKLIKDKTDIFGKINIGNNCFIGLGSIILPGVTLADNIIVGAGSVITKSFKEEGVVIGGNPAKVICYIQELKNKTYDLAHDMRGFSREERKKYLIELDKEMFIKK